MSGRFEFMLDSTPLQLDTVPLLPQLQLFLAQDWLRLAARLSRVHLLLNRFAFPTTCHDSIFAFSRELEFLLLWRSGRAFEELTSLMTQHGRR
jgi:hypothetical protein